MEFWLAVLVLAVLVLAVLVLAVLVTALLAELGLVFDDDVHPAIITVAPATTTSTKMRCFFIFSSPTDRLRVANYFVMHCSLNEV